MFRLLLLVFTVSAFFACAKTYRSYAPNYQFSQESTLPDYSRLEYWAAHPWKKDPSDSVPGDLGKVVKDSLADVFYIHPTTYTRSRSAWNADINDPYINAKTDYFPILYQASVFNQHCRVFSPRYRQVHLSAFFKNNQETRAAFDTAYSDVRKAFIYYLAHFAKDRPLIIAGHSQGALMAERLLREFFDGKPLQKKLVAAYIIGWSIPVNSFKNIEACADSSQTGCFCGWRTLREGYIPAYVQREHTTSIVTNPLSWKLSTENVSSSVNKGSVLRNFNRVIPHTTNARIYEGVLWVNRPKFAGSVFFRRKNYHVADMNLFYMNLRENAAQRIFSFLNKY